MSNAKLRREMGVEKRVDVGDERSHQRKSDDNDVPGKLSEPFEVAI